jgi:hypothetical protein
MDRRTDELYQELLDRLRHALQYEQETKRALLAALNTLTEIRAVEREEENDA